MRSYMLELTRRLPSLQRGVLACVVGMVLLVATACAGNGALGGGPLGRAQANAAAGLPPSANAMILQGDRLALQQGGTVLDAIRSSLPAIRVSQAGADCPSLAMRGPNTLPGVSEPRVYVDGAAATNTCVLQELPADQVARVEVYPMGFTPRPGYAPSGNGLILVFSRRASDDLGEGAAH